ncbi:hypothetical protein TNCT_102891, partial [Trichonephila clavata]
VFHLVPDIDNGIFQKNDKVVKTRLIVDAILRSDCKHRHQNCTFNQDCCLGTYCFEEEGLSNKRFCDVQ